VTNVNCIFGTSPDTKPKDKNVEGTWHIISPLSEKAGGTRLPCFHLIAPMMTAIFNEQRVQNIHGFW